MRISALALGVLTLGALAACGNDRTQVPAPRTPRVIEPIAWEGGVYYFPATGNDYRASLVAFRKAKPDLRCTYFGADDDGPYGHVSGHTIVCTGTAAYAQDVTVP